MATLTPYLAVHNAAEALEFYTKGLGGEEVMRLSEPGGRVGHAEVNIGGALLMLSDEYPDIGCVSPKTLNGTGVTLHLMVDNVDELVARAVAAGATLDRPIKNEFYGHRAGVIIDPFGHRWMISTEVEKLSAEEIERRAREVMMA